jgi:hypothetical protein
VQGYTGINAAGQPQDFDGRPFLYSPKFQGGLTALFDHDLSSGLKLQAALNGRWQGKSSADLEGNPLFAIDGYGLLNASVGLSSPAKGWALSLWGRNLTDEYYWSAVSSNANVVVRFPGKPTDLRRVAHLRLLIGNRFGVMAAEPTSRSPSTSDLERDASGRHAPFCTIPRPAPSCRAPADWTRPSRRRPRCRRRCP